MDGGTKVLLQGDPRGALLSPCPGQEGPQRVPKPFASPPLPQHHSQACISAHRGALLLLSGAPLGNRGQRGGGCPPSWGTSPRAPQGLGRGGHGYTVLVPSSTPRCALGPGKEQSTTSPQVPAEGPSCSPPPAMCPFSGVPAPRRLCRPGGRCRGPACRSPGAASVPSGSPPTYGLSWPHGSVLGRVPDWGSQSCSPSGSIRPPPQHPSLRVPAAPGQSRREPPPASLGCPAQQVPPLRLNIDRCQPRGRAATARWGTRQGGRGGGRQAVTPRPWEPGRGVQGAPDSCTCWGSPTHWPPAPPSEPWDPHGAHRASTQWGGMGWGETSTGNWWDYWSPGDAGGDRRRSGRGFRGAAVGGRGAGTGPGSRRGRTGGAAPPARGGPSPPGSGRGGGGDKSRGCGGGAGGAGQDERGPGHLPHPPAVAPLPRRGGRAGRRAGGGGGPRPGAVSLPLSLPGGASEEAEDHVQPGAAVGAGAGLCRRPLPGHRHPGAPGRAHPAARGQDPGERRKDIPPPPPPPPPSLPPGAGTPPPASAGLPGPAATGV